MPTSEPPTPTNFSCPEDSNLAGSPLAERGCSGRHPTAPGDAAKPAAPSGQISKTVAIHDDHGSIYFTPSESATYDALRAKYEIAEKRYCEAADKFHAAYEQEKANPTGLLPLLFKTRNYWEDRVYGASRALGKFKAKCRKARRA